MDSCSLVDYMFYTVALICIFQSIRLLFADADLTLQWKTWFGVNTKSLSGKVVWITGASSGIGEYLAYELVKAECKLILSARKEDELDRVKKQCLLTGRVKSEDILVLPLDVLKFDTHKEALQKVLGHFNNIDILVNNAGRSQRALAKDTSLDVDEEIMKLNVIGTLSLTKTVLPHMIERKKGHLVFTSSVAGKLGAPISASYSATKHAIQGWCDAARIELASSNITITTICPGPVFSKVQEDAFTGNQGEVCGIEMKEGERRMKTERCAELMTTAIANNLDEVWIARQPVLLFVYGTQYMPGISMMVGKLLGRNMHIIKKLREGGPTLNSKT